MPADTEQYHQHTIIGGNSTKKLLNHIVKTIEGIEKWFSGPISAKHSKKKGKNVAKLQEDQHGHNICLKYQHQGEFQTFFFIRKGNFCLEDLIKQIASVIGNFSSDIIIASPYLKTKPIKQKKEAKVMTDEDSAKEEKVEKEPIKKDPLFVGINHLLDILNKRDWKNKTFVIEKIRSLIEAIKKGNKEKVELSLKALMYQLANPTVSAIGILQQTIEQHRAIGESFNENIMKTSDRIGKLVQASREINKLIEEEHKPTNKKFLEKKDRAFGELERKAIQKESQGIQGLANSIVELEQVIDNLNSDLQEAEEEIQKNKYQKSGLEIELAILRKKQAAVKQRIEIMDSVCKILTIPLETALEKVEDQSIERVEAKEEKEELKVVEKTIEEKTKIPAEELGKGIIIEETEDPFSDLSEKQKQLILDSDEKLRKSTCISSLATKFVKKLEKTGIKKSDLLLAIAQKGKDGVKELLEKKELGFATTLIGVLKRDKMFNDNGRLNFETLEKKYRWHERIKMGLKSELSLLTLKNS